MTKPRLRRAGLLAPVWSLRREDDLGIGDTAAMRELIDWAADTGVGFLQLLPINETGEDNSPYNAISSVALEPALLDLSALPELTPEDIAGARGELPAETFSGSAVDYDAVKKLKRGLLEKAFARFREAEQESERSQAFTRFRTDEADWLDDYCLFRFLMELEGGKETWNYWSIRYNTPDKARAYLAEQMSFREEEVIEQMTYYAWVQWIAFGQWRDLHRYADEHDVKLMGDVPIGISYCSVDVFFEREWFDLHWYGGAPPETIFKDDAFACKWGQNWGIPLYRWGAHEESGFRWWTRRIDKLTDAFHIFRIDHILGFYRIYAFPWHPRRNAEFLPLSHEEAAGRTGGDLPGFKPHADDSEAHCQANLAQGDKLLKAVQKAAGENEVVGEDLGAVPDYVRPHLKKIGIAGFKIPHWEVQWNPKTELEHPIPGSKYEKCSFATYATHDHPPIAAMWNDFRANLKHEDEGMRVGAEWNMRVLSEIGKIALPKEGRSYRAYSQTIQWALIDALMACRSDYAAIMITDLFGLSDRFNTPGTSGTQNWRLRMPFTVAEMSSTSTLVRACKRFAKSIRENKR